MRTSTRLAAGLTAFVGAMVVCSGTAGAHVTVNSPGATQGGYAVLTFRVPTESDTASTLGLRVRFPAESPLASVSVEAMPGWSYKVKTQKLATPIDTDDGPVSAAVDEVDWTATGAGIKPGEFAEFSVSAGPLPKKASMTFKAIQHYSDDKDVAWVEVAGPGSAEPEHPAPVLALAPAGGTSVPATASPSPTVTVTASAAPSMDMSSAATSTKGASTAAVTVAIVLGALGVALGAAGLWSGRAGRRRAG